MQMKKGELTKYLRKIGRKGGKASGKARLVKLTPEQRSELARKAAVARWTNVEAKPAAAKAPSKP